MYDDYFTIKEAAEYLGMTKIAFHKMRSRNSNFPGEIKMSNEENSPILIPKSEIYKFAEKRRKKKEGNNG